MMAACNGNEECVNILLMAGADVNRGNNRGFSAVEIAKREGHEKCVWLLQNGLKPSHICLLEQYEKETTQGT